MAVTNDFFMMGLVFVYYIVLGVTWEFNISEKNTKFNIIRIMSHWLLIWISPLILQLGIEQAGDLGRSADIIKLMETFYSASIIVGIVISVFFGIFFIYNALLYFQGAWKEK